MSSSPKTKNGPGASAKKRTGTVNPTSSNEKGTAMSTSQPTAPARPTEPEAQPGAPQSIRHGRHRVGALTDYHVSERNPQFFHIVDAKQGPALETAVLEDLEVLTLCGEWFPPSIPLYGGTGAGSERMEVCPVCWAVSRAMLRRRQWSFDGQPFPSDTANAAASEQDAQEVKR